MGASSLTCGRRGWWSSWGQDERALVTVNVKAELESKLAAVAAHSGQLLEASSFMGLPAGAFRHLLGTEWFRVARRGRGDFSGHDPTPPTSPPLSPSPSDIRTAPARRAW